MEDPNYVRQNIMWISFTISLIDGLLWNTNDEQQAVGPGVDRDNNRARLVKNGSTMGKVTDGIYVLQHNYTTSLLV